MLRRLWVFLIFFSSLGLLTWGSHHLGSFESEGTLKKTPGSELLARRVALIETLDRLVAYQHHYRSVYGQFTRVLSRVGFLIPASVAAHFDIRVVAASHHQLLVTAVSDPDQSSEREWIMVDQTYGVRANFAVPEPRPEFLKTQALRHLRSFHEGSGPDREGAVYAGFFRYEWNASQKAGVAVGLRAPVQDLRVQLTMNGQTREEGRQIAEASQAPHAMSESLEQAYLAQKIFYAETGRYAKTWSELSTVTSFRFEDVQKKVPFGASGEIAVIELQPETEHKSEQFLEVELVRESHASRHGRVPASK